MTNVDDKCAISLEMLFLFYVNNVSVPLQCLIYREVLRDFIVAIFIRGIFINLLLNNQSRTLSDLIFYELIFYLE